MAGQKMSRNKRITIAWAIFSFLFVSSAGEPLRTVLETSDGASRQVGAGGFAGPHLTKVYPSVVIIITSTIWRSQDANSLTVPDKHTLRAMSISQLDLNGIYSLALAGNLCIR